MGATIALPGRIGENWRFFAFIRRQVACKRRPNAE